MSWWVAALGLTQLRTHAPKLTESPSLKFPSCFWCRKISSTKGQQHSYSLFMVQKNMLYTIYILGTPPQRKKNTIIKNSLSFTEGLVALWHFGRYLREAWLHFQDSLEQSWIHIFNPGCNGGFCGDISIYVSYIHIIINIIRILM